MQGWNVFKQIFLDHGEGFKRKHPFYDKQRYDDVVMKMLGCGNPDEIRRGKYGQREKETFKEEGNGRAIRSSTEGVQIPLLVVCGTELLVSEAIIDAGIGMAKFNNEYYEGHMPKVGCPGCSNYTMKCIE